MGGYRPEARALVEPGICAGRIDGSGLQLVTVRLFCAPCDQCDAAPLEDAYTHLRPGEARELALALLAAAEHAGRLTEPWERG